VVDSDSRDAVTSSFFQTIGMSIDQGRAFTGDDARQQLAVAVINRRMADAFWPAGSAVGQRFRFGHERDDAWYTVVGVTANLSNWDLSGVPQPTAYVPLERGAAGSPTLVVRTSVDPSALLRAVRDTVATIDPALDLRGPSS
jgi:putative ABC transport system permease protein